MGISHLRGHNRKTIDKTGKDLSLEHSQMHSQLCGQESLTNPDVKDSIVGLG